MDFLRWLFEAQIPVGGSVLVLREVLGNIFGLASALGGMRRKVWAWPIGIAGNLLLLTVFLGNVFGAASPATLWGQAGRQIMFVAVAVYGWYRWRQGLQAGTQGRAIVPGWASPKARIGMGVAMIAGTAALTPVFDSMGSYPPVWADAWTFMGSLLATYGMARGWTEFWLIWVAVDIVGFPCSSAQDTLPAPSCTSSTGSSPLPVSSSGGAQTDVNTGRSGQRPSRKLQEPSHERRRHPEYFGS